MEKKGKKGNEFSADSDVKKSAAGLFDKMICEVTIFVKHETDEEQAMKCLKDRKISCLELQVTTLEKKVGGVRMSTLVCVKALTANSI